MSDPNLQQLLAQVHERLRNTSTLDAQSREHLGETMRDIEKALAGKDAAAPASAPRLESLAVRFEAEHPAIAETLREIIDVLAKAGI